MTALRAVLRSLARSPRYSASVVLTLGLALAGADTLFAVAERVFLDALPFPAPDALHDVRMQEPDADAPGPVSHPRFRLLRDAAAPVAELGAYRPADVTLTGAEAAEAVPGAFVTRGLAEALGVGFAAGRSFTDAEDAPGGPAVAIVGHGFWRDRLGGDPAALGGIIELSGRSHTVVGILAEGAAFPTGAAIWLPLQNDDARRGEAFRFLSVIARVRPGATRADLAAAIERVDAAGATAEVRPLAQALLGPARRGLVALSLGVLGALAVASINLGALALVRTLARRGDHVVRLALGASRARLARGLAAELLVLGLAATLVGAALARVALAGVMALAPPEIVALGEPRLSAWVIVVGTALGLATALAASTLPLLTLPRANLAGSMRATGGRQRSARAFSLLLGGQSAVSLLLLVVAAALAHTLVDQSAVDPGFEAAELTEFRLTLGPPTYRSAEDRILFVEALEQRIARLPGVTAVGSALSSPLSAARMRTAATIDGGGRTLPEVTLQPVTPGLRGALGRTLLEGRDLTPDDGPAGEAVALVNASFARAAWPGESPLGREVRLETEPGGAEGPRTVVGVVQDVRGDLIGPVRPEVLIPYGQAAIPAVTVIVRAERPGLPGAGPIRESVAALAPGLPVTSFQPVEAHRTRMLRPVRLQAGVLFAFALLGVSLVLSSAYAVTAALAARRKPELALRLALGSSPGALRRLMLGWSLVPLVGGFLVGALGAVGVARALAGSVVGLVPPGPVHVLGSALALAALVFVVLLRPVRRASRVAVLPQLNA